MALPATAVARRGTRSGCSATCRTTRSARRSTRPCSPTSTAARRVLGLRRRPQGRRRRPLQRQPLHHGARELQHARAAADLGAGRQRLDRLLGPLRPGQSPYHDPIERLNFERLLFDSTSQSLGQKTLTLTRQSSEGGLYAQYSENVRWATGPSSTSASTSRARTTTTRTRTDAESGAVVVRSDAEIQRQRAEETARKAADLHWLDEGFAYARRIRAKGVVIDWQADPNFNNEQHLADPARLGRLPRLRQRASRRDPRLPRSGGARPRRLALLQDRQADQRAERRRARELHARRDLRRPQHALGERHRSTRTTRTSSSSSRASSPPTSDNDHPYGRPGSPSRGAARHPGARCDVRVRR